MSEPDNKADDAIRARYARTFKVSFAAAAELSIGQVRAHLAIAKQQAADYRWIAAQLRSRRLRQRRRSKA